MKEDLFTPEEKETIENYNQYSVQWYNQRVKRFHEFYLERFFHYLRHGRIIEFGCGNGDDARALIAKGYDYVGTDVSKTLIDWSKREIKDGLFYQASLYDLPFLENEFDGFWASAVLLHIPKSRIKNAFNEIRRVCKTGAIGFISVKIGTGEKIELEEFDGVKMKRFFVYYQPEEFNQLLAENGFKILEEMHKEANQSKWLVYFVQII